MSAAAPADRFPARPGRRARAAAVALAAAVLLLVRCAAGPAAARGHRIVAAGESVPIAAPVVLWTDPGGYDAYRQHKRFAEEPEPDGRRRYRPVRAGLPDAIAARVADGGWQLADLQQVVHLFVLHYDVAGTSRQCFKILHDVRFLSVHFLLDVDGTIYQTLDLQEHAHHATIANAVSVGVEIAHPGCWQRERHPDMLRWYERDGRGWFLKFPKWLDETGVRTKDFVPRPARPDVISGLVHGRRWFQPDYTPEQYRSLAHLCAALHRVFPRIRLEVPRNADGTVCTDHMPAAELLAFEGIVGHLHVQENKRDPGPAMDWERLLAEARAIAARGR